MTKTTRYFTLNTDWRNPMSPSKQSDSLQATNQPRPPVPFQLTLYPPSLRPNQYYTPKEEEVLIEISTDEELDQDEKYPEEATRNIEQLIEESSDKGLFHAKLKRLEKESLRRFENKWTGIISVSYTHLTLPTILRV